QPVSPQPFQGTDRRFIAHCLEAPRPTLSLATAVHQATPRSSLILIGPEGDFSQKELEWALENQFLPVTLGDRRLRTETAGLVAATLLCIG
ncbi:MAG TPA: RsmE family RNA methyltransferase, partial [Puia sp.]|nr:RsmE family RNA methyltransferase [Puia sp.]